MSNVVDSMPAPVSEAIKRRQRRRLNEEAHGAPCPHAAAAEIKAAGMTEADIIGWVADLLNDLRVQGHLGGDEMVGTDVADVAGIVEL